MQPLVTDSSQKIRKHNFLSSLSSVGKNIARVIQLPLQNLKRFPVAKVNKYREIQRQEESKYESSYKNSPYRGSAHKYSGSTDPPLGD